MRLASPFAVEAPADVARAAAEELMRELRAGLPGAGVELAGLAEPGRGKMFGVLVARAGGAGGAGSAGGVGGGLCTLRAFSGMLDGRWHVDGFAPPLFERAAYERVWPAAQRELRALEAEWRALGADGAAPDEVARRALERARAARSHAWWAEILAAYELRNARGERTTLRELHAPDDVPGGAGDCAAPKLLAEAYRQGLAPVAFAEFWWGAPPLTGGRVEGAYYPACRSKCGKVLPWMLGGLDVEDAPPDPQAIGELRVVWEDAAAGVTIVDKPPGLPSVPGRFRRERDSVLARLGSGGGEGRTAQVLHELDVEASGLVIVARDADVAVALHRQFARRELVVTYAAWVDREVAAARGAGGVLLLPLRLDREARPRRIVDEARGKRAVTEWQVRARQAGRTLLTLVPRTDRTHQLRVHAASGLGAAIVGDGIYGSGGVGGVGEGGVGGGGAGGGGVGGVGGGDDEWLALRAESVAFVDPARGSPVRVALEPW